ncbi:hypothetical protein REPUB_Repub18cG0001300 [Reevesia pubescens]
MPTVDEAPDIGQATTTNIPAKHFALVVIVSNEVVNYSSQAPMKLEENVDDVNDVLVNGCKYLTLATKAQDVLAIHVSIVAFESAFSTRRRVIDLFCSTLAPKMVEAFICTQNWLKSALVPIENEEKLDV